MKEKRINSILLFSLLALVVGNNVKASEGKNSSEIQVKGIFSCIRKLTKEFEKSGEKFEEELWSIEEELWSILEDLNSKVEKNPRKTRKTEVEDIIFRIKELPKKVEEYNKKLSSIIEKELDSSGKTNTEKLNRRLLANLLRENYDLDLVS